MREEIKHKIDDEEYTFFQMNPIDSLKLLTKLTRLAGISIGKSLTGEKAESIDTNLDVGTLIENIASRLDEDEVIEIVKTSLSQVIHSGEGELSKETAFNKVFGGRIDHLLRVVGMALKVEYSAFFGGGLDIRGLVKKAVQKV